MLNKGNKTKQFIINKSIELFAEKGYSTVTMKDICEICSLSRGGLYRYFGSTKEIFKEILMYDEKNMQIKLEKSIVKKVSPKALLELFLERRKKSIVGANNGLFFAIHEFAFIEKDQREYVNNRFNDAVEMLKILLKYGQKENVFKKFEIDVMALHIIFILDSMETSSTVLEMSEKFIDRQFNLIKEMVIIK